MTGQIELSRVAPMYQIRQDEEGRIAMAMRGGSRGSGRGRGESFYQALGYVSGGITQSRSESGEQSGPAPHAASREHK
ncbi:uncharacterized protein BO95DRAFT_439035 [Aspergillus brunneoviolaceus CBS 621.78]|uniref:Uncharacterized protein n=1 Tax=Aspergillus brunneoviolaceus CBS 621.78 TaxID=1450534 RepID=A0ACD1GL76_9EURO|nr:hypothetical protein BO95DRAFT_439035 [Aspergillus brunneoviolaceus CBS 621.78]RAH49831.1 hypothetical protein BO95DRAFT_439035 [Aspergillus brunneoviolaceus CBS 621.78]